MLYLAPSYHCALVRLWWRGTGGRNTRSEYMTGRGLADEELMEELGLAEYRALVVGEDPSGHQGTES